MALLKSVSLMRGATEHEHLKEQAIKILVRIEHALKEKMNTGDVVSPTLFYEVGLAFKKSKKLEQATDSLE
jgi:hypothetical protein